MDNFVNIEKAASEAAIPTPAQAKAGNYRKGYVTVYGIKIAIETKRNGIREGVAANGKKWQNIMKADYGHCMDYKGNDGDGVDVFIGSYPESTRVWIINQRKIGTNDLDEHKVMLAYHDEESAVNAYTLSYDRGWGGLMSIIPCTIDQLKWWLKYGDKSKPVKQTSLPQSEGDDMNENTHTAPFYLDDDEGLLLDSVTVADILEDADEVLALDALVIPFNKVERKMGQMQRIMAIAGAKVEPVAVQVTPPFKQKGTTNVAAVFELSDGQTVSVFFHNPDVTPNKILPTDELVSWKWMLNKKDVTILVAPELGNDLNIREVSRRIMKLAEKNSARFTKANTARAERLAAISGTKSRIGEKEALLASLRAENDAMESKLKFQPQSVTGLAPTATVTPITATGGVGSTADSEFLQSVIDGKQNLFDVSVTQKVAAIAKADNGALAELIGEAKTVIKLFLKAAFDKKAA